MRYSDGLPSCRSSSTVYPRLRRPVSAARVVWGSQPVASTSASKVAPAFLDSILMISACFDPDRGSWTLRERPRADVSRRSTSGCPMSAAGALEYHVHLIGCKRSENLFVSVLPNNCQRVDVGCCAGSEVDTRIVT